jgi:hypothetical protein
VCPHPVSSGQVTQACFDRSENQLTRADGLHPSVIGKRYMYVTKSATKVTSKWRLPAGVSCPGGCVLQWVSWCWSGCSVVLRVAGTAGAELLPSVSSWCKHADPGGPALPCPALPCPCSNTTAARPVPCPARAAGTFQPCAAAERGKP